MEVVSLRDLERISKQRTVRDMWDFIDGAAFDEVTKIRNEQKFKELSINPSFLVDIGTRSTKTTILGEEIDFPIMIAPSGGQRQHHPEGELATARGAGMAGTLFALPTASGYSIEEVANVASGPLWFQLYHSADEITENLVIRAKNAGYKAICLTIDTPTAGPKEKDLRNDFRRVSHLHNGSFRDNPEWASRRDIGPRDFADWDITGFRGLTWERLGWLKSLTGLPLVVKGVRTVKDAVMCAENGVDGIVVSNHGGRQIDKTLSSIETLQSIAEAVGDRLEVYLDSGVRRGSDAFIAIALGAKGVFVGRPLFWGLSYDGAEGVKLMLDILRSEFDRTMAFCGFTRVSDINSSAVHVPSTWNF